MNALKILDQAHLNLELVEVHLRELAPLKESLSDIYSFKDNRFQLVIPKQTLITLELIKKLLLSGHRNFFIHLVGKAQLIEYHREELRGLTRSLSIGNPIKKGIMQMKMLTLNMNFLYNSPSDDEGLSIQYQSAKNLALFLLDNPKIIKEIYHNLKNYNFHFALKQPLVSSILLLHYLKMTYQFNESEMVNLFVTSYFKDIGMSLIPEDIINKPELNLQEKLTVQEHANNSAQILIGRIPLGNSYMKIIENHHHQSHLSTDGDGDISDRNTLFGIETTLISVLDIISAMISERPYRKSESLYLALEVVKPLISDKHPQEFKLLVHSFQKFFNK